MYGINVWLLLVYVAVLQVPATIGEKRQNNHVRPFAGKSSLANLLHIREQFMESGNRRRHVGYEESPTERKAWLNQLADRDYAALLERLDHQTDTDKELKRSFVYYNGNWNKAVLTTTKKPNGR